MIFFQTVKDPECFDDQPIIFTNNYVNGTGTINQWNWDMGGTLIEPMLMEQTARFNT